MDAIGSTKNLSSADRFEQIYADTYYKLFGFVQRYLKDQQAVKDILQECYIRLWEKMGTIRDDEKIMPMLRTWAINATINAVRKDARDRERAYIWQERQERTCTADSALYINEAMIQYRAAINGLPLQQRLVFNLTKEEGLSQQETAETLQISIHTVKRHLAEAMRTLRAKIPENTLAGILIVAATHAKLLS